MATNKKCLQLVFLVFLGLLNGNCKKMPYCSQSGTEYTYSKPSVSYTPLNDSIPLGQSIEIEASVPKTFFDQDEGKFVTLTENSILGPLNIAKLSSTPFLFFAGAISDVELLPVKGYLTKDSTIFSPGQLESFRTAHWDGASPDSFKLQIYVRPLIRGTFFVSIRDQYNKDKDCALFRYLPEVINSDQHFYLITPLTNGEISEITRKFVYCFKVY